MPASSISLTYRITVVALNVPRPRRGIVPCGVLHTPSVAVSSSPKGLSTHHAAVRGIIQTSSKGIAGQKYIFQMLIQHRSNRLATMRSLDCPETEQLDMILATRSCSLLSQCLTTLFRAREPQLITDLVPRKLSNAHALPQITNQFQVVSSRGVER